MDPQNLPADQKELKNNPAKTSSETLTVSEVPAETPPVTPTPPDLAIELLQATGIAILVLLILVLWGLTWLYGFRMGMKQERIKLRHQLKQTPANLNIEMANPPILKRVTSVGKNNGTLADFALVDLTTVDLPASI